MRVSPSQTTFNAGELSPLLDSRVDMAKYGNGCHVLSNFLPLPQGPLRRRPGSHFVQEVINSANRTWLAPFKFSSSQAFILEFGDLTIRFYANGGAVLETLKVITAITAAFPAVVTSAAHGYANGDSVYIASVVGMTAVNGGAYTVSNVTANTFELSGFNSSLLAPYVSGGTVGRVYKIVSPYSAASITNSDGTFALSMVQTGDVVFISGAGVYPQKLTRLGSSNWTIAAASLTDGPFFGSNSDPAIPPGTDETRTVYASAATGAGITLTASSAIFTAEKVGTLFLLEQKKIDGYKVWEVGKVIALNDERRSDSNTYKALTAATTGTVKPTHREGARLDGDTGVQWQYEHSGYGTARITAVAGLTATATVVKELPSQAVGLANASTKWSFQPWDSVLGFPAVCTFYRERLVFMRGAKLWASVPGDFENFAPRDGAETLPDSALSIDITSEQLNEAVWLASAGSLIVGTRGSEFSVGEVTTNDSFGPGNVQAKQETAHGSRQVAPARVGNAILFVQPSGRRVQNIQYSFNVNGYDTVDMTVLAEHIANGQIIQFAYAQEPHSMVWAACKNGKLICLTFMAEQEVMGWHGHSIAAVESVAVIPDSTGTFDQLWMIVNRTINGVTRRYVEYLNKEWVIAEDAVQDASYSDCSSTFNGVITGASLTLSAASYNVGDLGVTTAINLIPIVNSDIGDYLVLRKGGFEAKVEVLNLPGPQIQVRFLTPIPTNMRASSVSDVRWARNLIAGLGYLEGQTVTLTTQGAAHPNLVVTGGSITLNNRFHQVQVGLPAPCEAMTMRIEAGAQDGTAQGKTKRIHRVIFRFLETMGGKAGPQGAEDTIDYRSSADAMDNPIAPFSGDKYMSWPAGYETDARVRFYSDQALPVTILGIYPQMETQDGK